MAELRLDQVQEAFKASPSQAGSTKRLSLDTMRVDQLEMFGNDLEVDRKSYDLWYEKALESLTNADAPFLDWAGESVSGFLNFAPDIANSTVLGVTSALGNITESFSSLEKLKEGVGSILAAGVQSMLYLDDPTTYRQYAEAMGVEPAIKGPGDVADESELIASPDANIAERLGKRLRALSFYGYANTKAFQQHLATQADHPLLMQVGGAFGSISTSALLASVNPSLAMWAIGGHVGASQYLEQTARGADFVPALGYATTIGVGVSQLERMSINLLFKKYSNRWALTADAAVTNAFEEFTQSIYESGIEQVAGAEDRTLMEIFKQASFEAALGFIGGGAAGATTVQFAYNRMDAALRDRKVPKNARHRIIMRAIGDGSSLLESTLREGMGITEDDLDLVAKINKGEINATEMLVELNKRFMARRKASGIDTYLDTDPEALIEQQRKIDAAEEAAAKAQESGVPLTPDEQAAVKETLTSDPLTGKFTTSQVNAVGEAANIVSNFEPGGVHEDMEGNRQVVPGGFPEPLSNKGYKTKDIDTVVKKVKAGKALTEKQLDLFNDLITLYENATGETVSTGPGVVEETTAPLTKAQEKELKILREGREAQINQELDLLESEKEAVVKEINQRKEAGKKPTKALQTKLDKMNTEIEALLDEIDLLPTAQREDLAERVIAAKGKRISALRNLAEVIAAREERNRIKEQFKQEKEDLKEARKRLAKYVRDAFKGKAVPKKFITRVEKVTPKTLDKFLAEVDQARLDIVRPALVAQINRVLARIAPKVKSGKAAGVLRSAALQDVANELIRISKIDAQTAAQLLAQKQKLLTNYFKQADSDDAVTGEINVDRLNFEMEVIQNLAGLEGKSEEELMASLEYVKENVKKLRAGQKAVQQQLQQQREQERAEIVGDMKPAPKFIPKWLRSFTHYSVNNLSSMLRSLIGSKDVGATTLGKKIAALEEAPRKEASFNFLYMDALEQITKRTFGLKNEKEYAQWKADWFTEGSGYDSGADIEFNDGSTRRLLLAKADVSYWWLVTHDRNGNEIPEMVEQFTGENARQALEEKAAQAIEDGAQNVEVDLSQVKGNAIPLEQWQDMMAKFEQDPRNIEFAQSQRALYNTVYSIINPVYRMYMGTDLPRVEDYIPWHRDVGVESEVFSALEDFNDLVQTSPRSTKLRTPGASAAFRQVGDIEIFQYFVQEMAHFNAFALPMKDIISVIRSSEVRNAINKHTDGVELANGRFKDGDSYKNLRKMADYVMSRGKSMNEFSLGLFNTFRSNISIAYLGEPSKAIMQTSSMWMALVEPDITWGDWVAGFADFMADPAGVMEILNKAPMMKFRYRDLMIEMKDAIEYIKRKDKKVNRFRRWVTPKAFSFVRAGNRVGAGISGWVIFNKIYKETGDINEAFRRFDDHLVNTQQSAVGTQLSPYQAGGVSRLLAHFQSAVVQYARLYVRAIDDFGRGRIGLKKLADTMFVFHILMPAMRWLLKALIRGGDFDDKELVRDVIIGPLTAGFLVPDLFEAAISGVIDAGFWLAGREGGQLHSFGASSTLAGGVDKITKQSRKLSRELRTALRTGRYDAADLAISGIELGEEASALLAPVPGITYDMLQATIKASQGDMEPMEILSVILGESVESLEFKNKGSNNRVNTLLRGR